MTKLAFQVGQPLGEVVKSFICIDRNVSIEDLSEMYYVINTLIGLAIEKSFELIHHI